MVIQKLFIQHLKIIIIIIYSIFHNAIRCADTRAQLAARKSRSVHAKICSRDMSHEVQQFELRGCLYHVSLQHIPGQFPAIFSFTHMPCYMSPPQCVQHAYAIFVTATSACNMTFRLPTFLSDRGELSVFQFQTSSKFNFEQLFRY